MAGKSDQFGYYNGSNQTNYAGTSSTKYCFGNGYQGTIGLKYPIIRNFCVELGAGYLLGESSKASDDYTNGYNPSTNYIYNTEVSASMMRYMIGFSNTGSNKVSVTAKGGLLLTNGKVKVKNKSEITSSNLATDPNIPTQTILITTTNTSEQIFEYYGGVSFGFYCGAGVNYQITSNLSASLLLDVFVQGFSPKKSTMTKYIYNGNNVLDNAPISAKEREFVKDPPAPAYNAQQDPNSPTQLQKFSMPLSSFGPSIRIAYTFGEKISTETPSAASK